MKRSWLIGAALVLSLTAVGCDDDDGEAPPSTIDGGADAGHDSGVDASGLDASKPDGGDAG